MDNEEGNYHGIVVTLDTVPSGSSPWRYTIPDNKEFVLTIETTKNQQSTEYILNMLEINGQMLQMSNANLQIKDKKKNRSIKRKRRKFERIIF